jgi:hypothetical protein
VRMLKGPDLSDSVFTACLVQWRGGTWPNAANPHQDGRRLEREGNAFHSSRGHSISPEDLIQHHMNRQKLYSQSLCMEREK